MTYDVLVVGARCAGAPLATLLARSGARVALVERAPAVRDTLSGHVFQADALAFAKRLGVADRLRQTGAPFITNCDIRLEDLRWQMNWPQQPGDIGGVASIRRFRLDPILVEAAERAGAELCTGAAVTGLLEEAGRVAGVRVLRDGREQSLRARLVVGADGRNSTVAKLCGARQYNVTENERVAYWSFFDGVQLDGEPTFVFHRWGNDGVLALPTDDGLYQAAFMPPLSERDHFRRDLEGSYMDYVHKCEPVAEAVGGARRVGKIFGAVRWTCFFREAAGPGWALAGDAGHFKDPAAGRGIGDAFRQAESLAPAIEDGLHGDDAALDRAVARWGRRRDREFAGQYWFAHDMGKAGPVPTPGVEVARRLATRGKQSEFPDLFNHRLSPSDVFTPPRLVGAMARKIARSAGARPAVLRELTGLVAEDARRRLLNHRPAYVAVGGAEAR